MADPEKIEEEKQRTWQGRGRKRSIIRRFTELQAIKNPAHRAGFLVLGAWQCPTLAWRMPHYHRRYRVSLLSSAWDQVVPRRYGRQANSSSICPEQIETAVGGPEG